MVEMHRGIGLDDTNETPTGHSREVQIHREVPQAPIQRRVSEVLGALSAPGLIDKVTRSTGIGIATRSHYGPQMRFRSRRQQTPSPHATGPVQHAAGATRSPVDRSLPFRRFVTPPVMNRRNVRVRRQAGGSGGAGGGGAA